MLTVVIPSIIYNWHTSYMYRTDYWQAFCARDGICSKSGFNTLYHESILAYGLLQEKYIIVSKQLINSLVAWQVTVSTVLDVHWLLLLRAMQSDRRSFAAVHETLARITVLESRGLADCVTPLVCPRSIQRRLTAASSHALSSHTGCQSPSVNTSTIPPLASPSVRRTSPSLWSAKWNHNL